MDLQVKKITDVVYWIFNTTDILFIIHQLELYVYVNPLPLYKFKHINGDILLTHQKSCMSSLFCCHSNYFDPTSE